MSTTGAAVPPHSRAHIQRVLAEFGTPPMADTSLCNNHVQPDPQFLLGMLLDAMLKCRPISHNISHRTVKKVIDNAGYCDINRLRESSWEDKTMVLASGGYSRYREQTATNLGILANIITDEYGELLALR